MYVLGGLSLLSLLLVRRHLFVGHESHLTICLECSLASSPATVTVPVLPGFSFCIEQRALLSYRLPI